MKERPIPFSAPMVRAILEGRKTQTRRVVKPEPVQPAADCHPKHVAKHAAPYLDAYCSQRKTPENPRGMSDQWCWWQVDDRQCLPTFRCPYGVPGDRLWVKETWQHARQDRCSCPQPSEPCPCDDWMNGTGCRSNRGDVIYRADVGNEAEERAVVRLARRHGTRVTPWRSSIFMSRWASRITLEVTGIRVERLQEISEDDARAEGVEGPGPGVVLPGPFDEGRGGQPGFCVLGIGTFPTAASAYRVLWESINGTGSWDENPWVWVVEFKRAAA